MALGVDETVDLVLNYLESNPDPNELAESLPYAAWSRLCMHICCAADFSAAEEVFAAIISKRPAVRSPKPCPAHNLVAEFVLALEDSVVEGIDSAAALQPVLVSTASALFNCPRGPTQSAQIQLGMKMLGTLISHCSSFCRYAAGHPALAAAMGRVLYCSWSTQVSTAVEALLEKLLSTDCRTAFLDSTSGLLTGNSSPPGQRAGTFPVAGSAPRLTARAHACCLLEAMLSTKQQDSNMAATAAGAMQGTAMQDVLRLLLDVQALFAPAVAYPAHAASASTSAAHGRVLRLTLAGKAPVPAGPATVTAVPASGAAATVAAHPAMVLLAVPASAQQPLSANNATVGSVRTDTGDTAAGEGVQVAPAQAAVAAAATAVKNPQASLLAAVAAALKGPAPTASASPGSPAGTGRVVTTVLETVATPPQQTPAQPVAAPALSQKPMPPKLLQVLISTLAKLTEQQPMQMVQAMVKSPGCLHIFLQLLDSSTKHPACREDAASIVGTCLCWAAADGRSAEDFVDLYLSTPGAITAAVHLLEDTMQAASSAIAKSAEAAELHQEVHSLLQALTMLASRGAEALPAAHSPQAHPVLASRDPRKMSAACNNAGVGAIGGSNGAGAGSSAAGSSLAGGNAAQRLANDPILLSLLLELVKKRANTGVTAALLDLLFPYYTLAEQNRIIFAPRLYERYQYVTFLSEVLQYPSRNPAHAHQAPAAARLLLQFVLTAPVRALSASHHQKAPGKRSPGLWQSQLPNELNDTVSVILSGLMAAIQPSAPATAAAACSHKLESPTSSSDDHSWQEVAAGLAQAAVHAAEALTVLARRRSGAQELSRPVAVERLLQLLEASAHPSTWKGLPAVLAGQGIHETTSGGAGKQYGSSSLTLDPALAAQYMHALGQVPGIVCLVAVQEPSFVPKLEQCSTEAAHLLAAALRLHFPAAQAAPGMHGPGASQVTAVPGALVDSLQGFPAAAVQLSKRWEALARALRPQRPWEQWQDSPTWKGASLTDVQQQQQQQQGPVGLSREQLVAHPEDVSFCVWGLPAEGSGSGVGLEDTAGSQPQQSSGVPQALVADRSTGRIGLSAVLEDGELEGEAVADAVVFVTCSSAAKAADAGAADEGGVGGFWKAGSGSRDLHEITHVLPTWNSTPSAQQHHEDGQSLVGTAEQVESAAAVVAEHGVDANLLLPLLAETVPARAEDPSVPFYDSFMLSPRYQNIAKSSSSSSSGVCSATPAAGAAGSERQVNAAVLAKTAAAAPAVAVVAAVASPKGSPLKRMRQQGEADGTSTQAEGSPTKFRHLALTAGIPRVLLLRQQQQQQDPLLRVPLRRQQQQQALGAGATAVPQSAHVAMEIAEALTALNNRQPVQQQQHGENMEGEGGMPTAKQSTAAELVRELSMELPEASNPMAGLEDPEQQQQEADDDGLTELVDESDSESSGDETDSVCSGGCC